METRKNKENEEFIDQFLSYAFFDIEYNNMCLKELTNSACKVFSIEDKEYKQVEKVIKKYEEQKELFLKINHYNYFLNRNINDVIHEWFDKNSEFGYEYEYLEELISLREKI